MRIRSWIGPVVSAIAVLVIGGAIALQGEELIQGMDWSGLTSALPGRPQIDLSNVLAYIAQPWVMLPALAVILFALGFWIGRVVERMVGTRPRDLESLANKLFKVCNLVKEALFNHEESLDPKIEAEVKSLFSRFDDMGVVVPEIDFDNMDLRKIEALWIYLESVYPVIIEGNANQAKTMSQNLAYDFHDKVAALR